MRKFLFVQLGSPSAPNSDSLRTYLKEFLGDPRVVDSPSPWIWSLILNLFILPFRPKKSAKLYSRIWDGKKFPLIKNSEDFLTKIKTFGLDSDLCYLLSSPRLDSYFLSKNPMDYLKHHWVIVPLFPQFCEATTLSVYDQLHKSLSKLSVIPSFEFLPYFYQANCFIQAVCNNIKEAIKKHQLSAIIVSFHGIPLRRVLFKKDPYYDQCIQTFNLIQKEILQSNNYQNIIFKIGFQSRFGSEEWIGPYLEDVVKSLPNEKIGICTPSFVADCLETLDEIGHELKHSYPNTFLIPSLNDQTFWCQEFASYLKSNDFLLEKEKGMFPMTLSENELPKLKSPPLTANAKNVIKIMFLTLFLDLVGFSIIFPLFPSMAKFYLENDTNNIFLNGIFSFITNNFAQTGISHIVLFGGILGALYSLLQFLAAPFWGSLSDKIGRRPVLLISLFFLIISYAVWFFAQSFSLLILARIIGGLMAGNISTATAVVADVTPKENRSKGMAFVGLAFALGFILGPALGGLSSKIQIGTLFPELISVGVNPFSACALLACLLSIFNFFWILLKFPETLSEENKNKASGKENFRSSNPILLFKPLPYKGVNLTNFGHFLFLLAFSGMEFTLTFLASERLGFNSLNNAYMFIFIGVTLAIVQGGFVRRKAHLIGEKKLTLYGLLLLIPGLLAIGFADNILVLYFGLFFLALGAGIIIPCLTSLVSLLTPAQHQGQAIGIFRSLGALSRVIGPIIASLIYYKWGSSYPYFLGSIFILIPFFIINKLPKDPIHVEE